MSHTQPVQNSLFLTPAWTDHWWRLWGNTPGFERTTLSLGAQAHGAHADLPLYLDRQQRVAGLPATTLQFVGTSHLRLSTPRAEYLDIRGELAEADAPAALSAVLDQTPWHQCILRDIDPDGLLYRSLTAIAPKRGWKIRKIYDDSAFFITTDGKFDDYLAFLGKSTRLRVYNRRTVLNGLGALSFKNLWPDQPEQFFALLNEFHLKRWGQPCFNPTSTDFHLGMIRDLAAAGGDVDLSVMQLDGAPISVLYNLCWQGRVYNIQSGFDENLHPKLALGSLHLGYAIETAFQNPNASVFDLLAGGGKNTDYKSHLCPHQRPLVSLQVLRAPWLKAVYGLHDWRKQRMTQRRPKAEPPR